MSIRKITRFILSILQLFVIISICIFVVLSVHKLLIFAFGKIGHDCFISIVFFTATVGITKFVFDGFDK